MHAKIAYDKGDYEFGLSLLEKGKAEHLDQINELEAAIRLRDSHAARVAVLRKAALAMLAFIIVFGSAALYFINDAKNEAVAAKLEEEKAKDKAIASEQDAIAAREKEEKARLKEEMARLEEKKAKEEALVSEQIAVAAKEKEEKARLQEEKARLEEKKAKEKAQEAERVAVAAQMEEELIIHTYDRLSPLDHNTKDYVSSYRHLKPGDCVVAFKRRDLYTIKRKIERTTGRKCCIIYGALPPAIRKSQAVLYNTPNNGHDILVATDAVGMGLNLAIKRVIFETMTKFNGMKQVELTPAEVRQIGGRAGRYKSQFPKGYVTCRSKRDLQLMHKKM